MNEDGQILFAEPNDYAAEQAVVGAVLAGTRIDGLDLTPEDFYQPAHAAVWATCARLAASGRKPDPLTVADADPGIDRLLLADCLGVASMSPAEHARIVREHSDRRWIIAQCAGATKQARDLVNPAYTAETLRVVLDERNRQRQSVVRLSDVLPGLIDGVQSGSGTIHASTPWADLDHLIRGFAPGRLYVVGGRPGQGKSLWGQGVAAHVAAKHDQAAFIASLEMTAGEYATRFLSADSSVPMRSMESSDVDEGGWARISASYDKLAGWPVWINDTSRQSLGSIRADARQVASKHPLGVIVIDYLQLLDPPDRRAPRVEQVGQITRALKRLAKELHVPVVLLAQLNREGAKANRQPKLEDLRESGDIEQDADVVILLHNPTADEPAGPGGVEIQAFVAKNRQGPQGVCDLLLQGQFARLAQRAWSPSGRHS